MQCTPCGQEVDHGTSAIYGIEREGKLHFGWTCCHKPVGDAAVILASSVCAAVWVEAHPEYAAEIDALVASVEHHKH